MSNPKQSLQDIEGIYEFQEGDACEESLDQLELAELLAELDYPYLEGC